MSKVLARQNKNNNSLLYNDLNKSNENDSNLSNFNSLTSNNISNNSQNSKNKKLIKIICEQNQFNEADQRKFAYKDYLCINYNQNITSPVSNITNNHHKSLTYSHKKAFNITLYNQRGNSSINTINKSNNSQIQQKKQKQFIFNFGNLIKFNNHTMKNINNQSINKNKFNSLFIKNIKNQPIYCSTQFKRSRNEQQNDILRYSQSVDNASKKSNQLIKTFAQYIQNPFLKTHDQNFNSPIIISNNQFSTQSSLIDFNSTFRPSAKLSNYINKKQNKQSSKISKLSHKQIDKCQIDIQLDYLKLIRDKEKRLKKNKNQSKFEKSLILNQSQKQKFRMSQYSTQNGNCHTFNIQKKKNRFNAKRFIQQNPQQFSPWNVAQDLQSSHSYF